MTGYDVRMSYGGDPTQLAAGGELNGEVYSQHPSSQHSSMRRSHASQSSNHSYGQETSIHPFPPFNNDARVDAGGTGGLAEPTADGRRQSYDEGDEYALMENQRFPDEPPDFFYTPPPGAYRPLPNLPEGEGGPAPPMLQTDLRSSTSSVVGGGYGYAADGITAQQLQHGQFVPRSTSLMNHTTTPQVSQPGPLSNGSTAVVPRTNIQVDDSSDKRLGIVRGSVTLRDLVASLNALGVGPRDLISILQAIKAAGALQADLQVR